MAPTFGPGFKPDIVLEEYVALKPLPNGVRSPGARLQQHVVFSREDLHVVDNATERIRQDGRPDGAQLHRLHVVRRHSVQQVEDVSA